MLGKRVSSTFHQKRMTLILWSQQALTLIWVGFLGVRFEVVVVVGGITSYPLSKTC